MESQISQILKGPVPKYFTNSGMSTNVIIHLSDIQCKTAEKCADTTEKYQNSYELAFALFITAML